MKKFLYLSIAMILSAGVYGQNKVDVAKEKEAIKAVIQAETQAYYDKDFDLFASVYKHDKSIVDLRASSTYYSFVTGWKDNSDNIKEYMKNNPQPVKNPEVKKNFRIHVYLNNTAWAVFDNFIYDEKGEVENKSIGVNFLEKINGKWKIVFLSRVDASSYKDIPVEL